MFICVFFLIAKLYITFNPSYVLKDSTKQKQTKIEINKQLVI